MIFFRCWKDFGSLEAEILDDDFLWARILEGSRLKFVFFFAFWTDFGRLGAEIFDSL